MSLSGYEPLKVLLWVKCVPSWVPSPLPSMVSRGVCELSQAWTMCLREIITGWDSFPVSENRKFWGTSSRGKGKGSVEYSVSRLGLEAGSADRVSFSRGATWSYQLYNVLAGHIPSLSCYILSPTRNSLPSPKTLFPTGLCRTRNVYIVDFFSVKHWRYLPKRKGALGRKHKALSHPPCRSC